jgi:hypothetical protein
MSANRNTSTHDVMWQTLSGLSGGSPSMTPRAHDLYSENPIHSAGAPRCRPNPANGKPRLLSKWFAR